MRHCFVECCHSQHRNCCWYYIRNDSVVTRYVVFQFHDSILFAFMQIIITPAWPVLNFQPLPALESERKRSRGMLAVIHKNKLAVVT